LYLEKGGLDEILSMNYWRFKSIIATLQKKRKIESGKPYIEKGLPQSSKDMIERRKKQRPRN